VKDRRQRRLGMAGSVATILGLTVAVAEPATAGAAPDIVQQDARRDAHPALDVVRVTVSHDDDSVKVVVRVRDLVPMDSAAKVSTAVGVHFDTSPDAGPEHLIRIKGGAILATPTWVWNGPDPVGPWDYWWTCAPDGWDKPLVRPRPAVDSVVFHAPRSCLEDPDVIRVAVQSYRPYRTAVEPDWLAGPRRYTPWISLL
jgi:hypothetical protein